MPAAIHCLPRHGALADFLDLTDGLAVDKVGEVLRCGPRSVRNYLAGRSPVPWWRIEALRLWRAQCEDNTLCVLPDDCAMNDVVTDELELLAWTSVIAPHFLSSERSFRHYVRAWDVRTKILRAKAEGSFPSILRQWREIVRAARDGPDRGRPVAPIPCPVYLGQEPSGTSPGPPLSDA